MSLASSEQWIRLRPPLSVAERSALMFVRCASEIARIQSRAVEEERDRGLSDLLDVALAEADTAVVKDCAVLNAATRVLCDLARQHWHVRVRDQNVEVRRPAELLTDPQAEKERVRSDASAAATSVCRPAWCCLSAPTFGCG